jgi:hypothetical protein
MLGVERLSPLMTVLSVLGSNLTTQEPVEFVGHAYVRGPFSQVVPIQRFRLDGDNSRGIAELAIGRGDAIPDQLV